MESKNVSERQIVGNTIMLSFFAYFALIMGTLKGSSGRFFNFSAQGQDFTGGLNGHDLS